MGRRGPHRRPFLGRIDELAIDERVRAAGLIGETFGIDPVAVLAEPDRFRNAIRYAAFRAVQTDKAAAQRP